MRSLAGCKLHWDTSLKLGGFLIVGIVQPDQAFSIDGRGPRVNAPGSWCLKREDNTRQGSQGGTRSCSRSLSFGNSGNPNSRRTRFASSSVMW